jgi:hypothetical protein
MTAVAPPSAIDGADGRVDAASVAASDSNPKQQVCCQRKTTGVSVNWPAWLALTISVAQAAVLVFAWVWPPKVTVLKPRLVSLWCESAMISETSKPTAHECGGKDSTEAIGLLADPFAYYNDSFGRSATVQTEMATIALKGSTGASKNPVADREFTLVWERIRVGEAWTPIVVQNVESNRANSHATAFFAGSVRCGGLDTLECLRHNRVPWSEFARSVVAGDYASIVITFEVQLLGSGNAKASKPCLLELAKDTRQQLQESLDAEAQFAAQFPNGDPEQDDAKKSSPRKKLDQHPPSMTLACKET